jgi:hypothetical protein
VQLEGSFQGEGFEEEIGEKRREIGEKRREIGEEKTW